MRLVTNLVLAGALALAALPALAAEKLVIAGRDGAYGDAMQLAVEQYKAANPGQEIEVLALPYGGLLEKLSIGFREKAAAYDVVLLDDTWAVEFMSKGWLADLGELDDDFVASAMDVSRYPVGEGPTYAVPHVGNVELFAYRRDLFEKYGLAKPESWTAVLEAADTIGSKETGVSGVVFRGQKANPIVTGFLPILWAFGGDVVDSAGKATLDTPAAFDALNLFLALKAHAPTGVENYNATEVRDALMQGKTAMSIELWPAWAPALDDPEKSKVAGKVEIVAAPGQTAGPSPMLGAWLVAVPADAPHPEAARKFVDFLTSVEVQKALALKVGTPPTRRSVYADPEVVAQYRWYPAQLDALQHAKPRARITDWSKVETVLGDYLQLALIGQLGPQEALSQGQAALERALAR